MITTDPEAARSRFEGMRRVVQFNWTLYCAAAAAIGLAVAAERESKIPRTLRTMAGIGASLVSLQTVASLVASHWVYDLSPLHYWRWLRDVCRNPNPWKIVNVIAGYDETTGALARVFPNTEQNVIDFFSGLEQPESSIQRARKMFPARVKPISQELSGWPFADGSIDLVLMPLSAHEVRDAAGRERLFKEAARVVNRSNGTIILVE
ncbi:MAG: class I SAM-dependent methyltransferase, partial [Terriglobales bacterium]